MRSRIDWNEVVPKLDAGLRQTLYLEAVKLISEKRVDQREYQREYQRRYQRERWHTRGRRRVRADGRRKKWTPSRIQRVADYRSKHTHTDTLRHFKISSSMLSKWGLKGNAKTAAAPPT